MLFRSKYTVRPSCTPLQIYTWSTSILSGLHIHSYKSILGVQVYCQAFVYTVTNLYLEYKYTVRPSCTPLHIYTWSTSLLSGLHVHRYTSILGVQVYCQTFMYTVTNLYLEYKFTVRSSCTQLQIYTWSTSILSGLHVHSYKSILGEQVYCQAFMYTVTNLYLENKSTVRPSCTPLQIYTSCTSLLSGVNVCKRKLILRVHVF